MYAFQRALPRNEKSLFMHAETRLRNHGIRLVVARHFHCLHKFKVACMRVALVGSTRARKSCSSSGLSARRYFTRARKRAHGNGDREMHYNDVSARGNAHMESRLNTVL